MYQLVVINWTLFCRDGCFPFKQLLWNCCHHLSLRGKKHEPKHTLSPTSTVLPVTFQIWFNHISTLPKLILITVAMTNILPCGSGVRQGTVFGLETCFVPDFRCHSVLEKDISLRYSDFSWSCSDITNTPVLLLWNSPSVHSFANSIFCMKNTMHMQTTSGPRSAGLTSLLRHDWSGMHSRPHPFSLSTTGRSVCVSVCALVCECPTQITGVHLSCKLWCHSFLFFSC